jgi:hypothetical protein
MCDLLEQSIKNLPSQEQQQQQQQAPGLSNDEVAELMKCVMPYAGQTGSGSLEILQHLCSMQCIKDAASEELITAQLEGALRVFRRPNWLHYVCMCQEPAAAAAAPAPAAAATTAGSTVRLLLGLPAAAHIPAHQLALHVDTILWQCSDDNVCEALVWELLCGGNVRLPALSMLQRLLQSCLHRKTGRGIAACVQLLCEDPAAQQLQANSVLELLQYAVSLQRTSTRVLSMVQVLCQLPGSKQLTAEQVERLLSAALSRSRGSNKANQRSSAADIISQTVHVLCGLPGAQRLQPCQLSRLLKAAAWGGYGEVRGVLCSLPGAKGLSCERLAADKEAGSPERGARQR